MTDSSQVCYKISDQRFVLPDQCIFASSTPVTPMLLNPSYGQATLESFTSCFKIFSACSCKSVI